MPTTEELEQAPMTRTDVLRASPPMFESRWLDMFTRVHWVVPVLIFLPAIIYLAIWGLQSTGVPAAIGLFAAGYVAWTQTEYWLHRIVFHFEPEHGIGARLHWMIHGVHHDHPNDPLRLVMPPSVSVPLGAAIFGGLYLVFGAHYAPGIGAGFFAGYLIYDMMHYYLHHARPRFRMGRWLRMLHMRHHFDDPDVGFGISAPYLDNLYKTSSAKRTSRPQK